MRCRVGPCTRGWQRPDVVARLGRRLRRLVYIQVPQLWPGQHWWYVRA